MPRMIVETKQEARLHPETPGYEFQVTSIPADLPTNAVERCEFDDRSISVPAELGSIWVRVYKNGDNSFPVAHAEFGIGIDTVVCDCIDVDEKHRRRRIATASYDIAEAIAEAPLQPSATQTADAEQFWRFRKRR